MHRSVKVAHSSFIEGSLTTKKTASDVNVVHSSLTKRSIKLMRFSMASSFQPSINFASEAGAFTKVVIFHMLPSKSVSWSYPQI